MIANLETFQNFPKKTQEFVLAGMTGDVARLEAAGRSTPPVWNQTRPPPSAAQATGSADAGRVVSSNIVAPPGRTVRLNFLIIMCVFREITFCRTRMQRHL